jgi:hypothetical protein
MLHRHLISHLLVLNGTNPLQTSVMTSQFTVEQVGYLINDSVAYVPPALKKSPFLLAVFAFKPIMIQIILVLSVLLHTSPINKAST